MFVDDGTTPTKSMMPQTLRLGATAAEWSADKPFLLQRHLQKRTFLFSTTPADTVLGHALALGGTPTEIVS